MRLEQLQQIVEIEKQQSWENVSLDKHMDIYMSQGLSKKEAMKKVASDRGISKRDVYQALLNDN